MAPRSERLLVEEVPLWQPRPDLQTRSISDAATQAQAHTKPKKTVRRLSDFMTSDSHKEKAKDGKQPSLASKRDIWLIYLTDVVIRCQRIGVTQHPIGALALTPASKSKSSTQVNQRNLYRFLQVEKWEMRDLHSKGGMVTMEEVARYRNSITSSSELREDIEEEDQLPKSESRMSLVVVFSCLSSHG